MIINITNYSFLMPSGINSPLGYSERNIVGYLPRLEIGNHPLLYEDALTSYPVRFNYQLPLLLANNNYPGTARTTGTGTGTTKFGKKKPAKKKPAKKKPAKKKPAKKNKTRLRERAGGSKRVSTTRKSPEVSATVKNVGTKLRGNDGNMWVVKKASNGVKRWIKINNN